MAEPISFSSMFLPNNMLQTLKSDMLSQLFAQSHDKEQIIYEFTRDRNLLNQYYHLREAMYRRAFDTDKFIGEEDLYDKCSYILIARNGSACLGGCRLTIREPDEKWKLPMESASFKLHDIFPSLPLDQSLHGEISRFAIMENDVNKNEIFQGLCKAMNDKILDLNIHYLFTKSTYTLARNWRFIVNKFGNNTTRICDEITVPENPIHPGVKWFVTLSDLSHIAYENDTGQMTSEVF